jgi:hypothetical protein
MDLIGKTTFTLFFFLKENSRLLLLDSADSFMAGC